MKIKLFFISGVVLFSGFVLSFSGCTPQDNDDTNINNQQGYIIGWLHGDCLAVKSEIYIKSSSLVVVNLESNTADLLQIDRKVESGESCYALLEDRASINAKDGRHFYTVISKEPVNLGIGLVFNADDAPKNTATIDLNSDGKQEIFTSCSTSEGMEFSVWSGEAYKSDLIWSDYYYLGYDTEADCPVRE